MQRSNLRYWFQAGSRELLAVFGVAVLLGCAITAYWWYAGDKLVENRMVAGTVVQLSVPNGGRLNPGTRIADVQLADGENIRLSDDLTLFRRCQVGYQLDVQVRRAKGGQARLNYVPDTCHVPALGVQPR